MMRQVLLSGGPALNPVRGRLSVDGHPHSDQFGYLLAGTLPQSWLGLDLIEGGAGFLSGDSGKELLARVARSRALPELLKSRRRQSGASSHSFERIHMDSSAGYVLDGELFEPNKPYVLQIKAGPPALFATL
jgi:hypothetical protein